LFSGVAIDLATGEVLQVLDDLERVRWGVMENGKKDILASFGRRILWPRR
jgi:hypothetical protein